MNNSWDHKSKTKEDNFLYPTGIWTMIPWNQPKPSLLPMSYTDGLLMLFLLHLLILCFNLFPQAQLSLGQCFVCWCPGFGSCRIGKLPPINFFEFYIFHRFLKTEKLVQWLVYFKFLKTIQLIISFLGWPGVNRRNSILERWQSKRNWVWFEF